MEVLCEEKRGEPRAASEDVILRFNHISKTFPGVKALDDVSFEIRRGETHALIGANGAGKSTLIKILAGIYSKDGGSIDVDGRENVDIKNPKLAQDMGISVVFQELSVFPDLNVVENIFACRELTKNGFYLWKAMRKRTKEILAELDLDFDIDAKVSTLSLAQQQMVEIARAVSFGSKIIVLDEPTSSLSLKETEKLFEIMRQLHERGITLVFVSHRLDEVYQNCKRITLLRDGAWVLTSDIDTLPKEELIRHMIGRGLEEEFPSRESHVGEELMRIEHFESTHFHDVSFTLHRGEVLGLAGLVGAGRTEVAKAIFGVLPKSGGTVYLEGKQLNIRDASTALKHGIAYATEDRKSEGLFLLRSIRENISVSRLDKIIKRGFLRKRIERLLVKEKIDELQIKTSGMEALAVNLSGGNQQKVCLAKWLMTSPKVLILDEPTRGIDVGAKAEFYRIIAELAEKGVGIILISSEEGELIGLCDRILVMYEGRIQGELTDMANCASVIMEYLLGLHNDAAENASQTEGQAC